MELKLQTRLRCFTVDGSIDQESVEKLQTFETHLAFNLGIFPQWRVPFFSERSSRRLGSSQLRQNFLSAGLYAILFLFFPEVSIEPCKKGQTGCCL